MDPISGDGPAPVLSLIVPVYNVAGYVAACLNSILTQPAPAIEVIVVDDGSTDDSPAIVAELARSEPRLRVITQQNAGLGAARNRGVTSARGEFLWFVDSDDLLAPGALPLMLDTIMSTGSDMVTGNVLRLSDSNTSPTRFLTQAFARTRLRTHIRRFPALIADRVAWNKIYRRSFWEHHAFQFPEGVHYEDQYVTIPAHYLARTVDVISEPVYLWRVRSEADGASITQQRHDPQSMRDRVRAVEYVSRFLGDHDAAADKRRYDAAAVTNDLRLFLDGFDTADATYREAFLAAVGGYLNQVDESAFAQLPVIRRRQWELARRGDGTRLAEAVRFEREDLTNARATRVGRHWFCQFPSMNDRPPAMESVQVRRELRLVSTIDDLSVDDDGVRVSGHASIDLVGPVAGRLQLIAVPDSVGVPLMLTTSGMPDGSYRAEISLAALRRASFGRRTSWRLVLRGRDHGLHRIAVWHESGATVSWASLAAVDGDAHRHGEVRIELTGRGRLGIVTGAEPPTVNNARIDADGVLDLLGSAGGVSTSAPLLVATASDGDALTMPVHVDGIGRGAQWVTRLPLAQLVGRGATVWTLSLRGPGSVWPIGFDGDPLRAELAGATVTVAPGQDGYVSVTIG